MAANFFGQIFRITTFGESHGPGIGVVIDGCPSNIPLTLEEIQEALDKRKPGTSPYTSPRKESDKAEILSGLFEGKTTGAPLTIFIRNHDADSTSYDTLKNIYRPGHAHFAYLAKYGLFDHRGGGRASARETAARVAAGVIAKKIVHPMNCHAQIETIGGLIDYKHALTLAKETGDSLGGLISCTLRNLIAGLGDPVYCKLPALLASAMLSIPACKGFEIDEGFAAASMKGSEHNPKAHSTLGGITTGEPLTFRVAFKPTSSIKKEQATTTISGEKTTLKLPENSRHDPCVAIRAVPVVEAMTYLVLADALLMHRAVSGSASTLPHQSTQMI